MMATPSSFKICLPAWLSDNDLLARPCTMIADDCMPTFPPVPPISGINKAIAGLMEKFPSKLPKMTELAKPPIIPISNHGNRADVCVRTVSVVSTSWEIPDANW